MEPRHSSQRFPFHIAVLSSHIIHKNPAKRDVGGDVMRLYLASLAHKLLAHMVTIPPSGRFGEFGGILEISAHSRHEASSRNAVSKLHQPQKNPLGGGSRYDVGCGSRNDNRNGSVVVIGIGSGNDLGIESGSNGGFGSGSNGSLAHNGHKSGFANMRGSNSRIGRFQFHSHVDCG